ncbi:tail fiber assembly protein [Kluyvera ascorbata]|uniref:tail fiber assembly protein n=1 Tax=Kluyvera ascorbata TaxID=51288 RepID=UPI0039F6D80B
MIKINQEKRKEVIAEQVRQQRDRLLAECDWRSLPDAPSNRDEWLAYRQQLRDITQQPGFPDNIQFPIPPVV